jgi:hypothetical protein
MNLSSYSKSDLEIALKGLKSYRALDKFIGRRGRELFHRARSGQESYRVEHFGTDSKSIETLVITAYNSHFGVKLTSSDIVWKQNDSLKGGARLFIGDDMLDISFRDAERKMKRG